MRVPVGELLRLLGYGPAAGGNLTQDEMAAALAEVMRTRRLTNEREPVESSPWLTVKQAALRAQCGPKTIYREAHAGRLRAARVGGRRDLRFRAAWIDEWLERSSRPVDVTPSVREVL